MAIESIHLLLVILWATLYIGFLVEEYVLLMLSSMGLIVVGVDIVINGITDLNNLASMAFGFFCIGVSSYVMIRANMEMWGAST